MRSVREGRDRNILLRLGRIVLIVVMPERLPHLSTDQIAAFVEVARHGQIRSAASVLGITEQGLRNRLIALEAQLGAELYRKSRAWNQLYDL